MTAKALLTFCAQMLLTQSVFSQCTSRTAIDASGIGAPYGLAGSYLAAPGLAYGGFTAPSMAYDGLLYPGAGYAGSGLAYDGYYAPAMEFTSTSGGAMLVTSSSAIPPTGISIVSDNLYEGALIVSGELPFVGTASMEGLLPTAGSGAINHACGSGLNAMSALSATSTPASVATMAGPAFATPGLAYNGLIAPFAAPALVAPAMAYDGLAVADAALVGRGLAYDSLAYVSPIEGLEITPTSGGALPVSSASAIPPTGISITSDNAFEGALALAGDIPFVGTVGMEGVLPTTGTSAINHACGNGRNAIISETAAFAPGIGAPAFGYRGGRGNGCGF